MGTLTFDCGCSFPCSSLPDGEILHVTDPKTDLPLGIDIDVYDLPHACLRTWAIFASGYTKGCFQLEGHLGRSWAAKIKPESIEELSALVSLIRPGCLKAVSGDPPKNMTQRYADRKHKLEDVEYYHPSLAMVLADTYGVLCYQEQQIRIACEIAGFTLEQGDVLRKGVGKKKADVLAKLEQEFVDGCTQLGIVNEEEARTIFGWIRQAARYSFNKSHGVGYSETSYWTAYMKAHFPLQFYCSWLDGAKHKQKPGEEVYELINDAKMLDIDVQPPRFKDQRYEPYIEQGSVRFGLGDIKGVGPSILKKLPEVIAAHGIPNTWIDYLLGVATDLPSNVNDAFVKCGALDYLERSRTQKLYELELLGKLTDKEIQWMKQQHQEIGGYQDFLAGLKACAPSKKDGGGCNNKNRTAKVLGLATLLEHPPYALNDTLDFIACSEQELLGASLSCAKVDGCMEAARATATCKEVLTTPNNARYTVLAVEVTRVKEITTKKGQRMAFMSIADHSCSLDDVVVFPDQWKEFGELLQEGNTVLVRGERSKQKSWQLQKAWPI